MIARWLTRKDKITGLKERFYPIAHAMSTISGDSTVENRLNEIGVVKGAGSGSVVSVEGDCGAEGIASVSMGKNNHALDYNTVFGRNAKTIYKGYDDSIFGDSLVIGNGLTEDNRANCIRGTYSGDLFAMKSFTTGGADYAEYFEWKDGNPRNEDRRGLFVTLNGDKITIANENSTYLLGIISANPCVIGNGDEDWQGRWLKDDFGAFLYEDGKPISNPDYDPSTPYIPREKRREWGLVGLMGVLVVVDDGTCHVNGFCKPSSGGIATASKSGYRVIKRVNDNLVKVLLR